jgi:hypothetical protein
VILTTDADAVVASNWIESNLRSIAAGADVVCGRALIDPTDALQIQVTCMPMTGSNAGSTIFLTASRGSLTRSRMIRRPGTQKPLARV